MSTTDPDDIRRTIRHRLVPFALPIAIIGVLSPFVLFVINLTSGGNAVWTFLAFVGVSVSAGLFGYYAIRPTPWVLAAYTVQQYVGGLLLVLSSGVALEAQTSVLHQGFWIVAVPYAVAAWCFVMWVPAAPRSPARALAVSTPRRPSRASASTA